VADLTIEVGRPYYPAAVSTASDHPRPDLCRDQWWPLDGEWGRASDNADEVRYQRRIDLPDAAGGRLLLRFGAVDYETTVTLVLPDGAATVVAHNVGGHVPFSADVTAGAGQLCEITVLAVDRTAGDQPRGKQMATRDEPFSEIRYPATNGIWQPIWLERVGAAHVDELHVRANADGSFAVDAAVVLADPSMEGVRVECELSLGSQVLASADAGVGETMAGQVMQVQTWSPDSPVLHDLEVVLRDASGAVIDLVHTRVGFRTITTDDHRILLNGKPIVFRMALDQGYWPDTLLELPSDESARREIEWLREAGFNGVRKHMKIEDPRWWRWADELGLMVWQDMPAGAFHQPAGPGLRGRLVNEWERAIHRDRSHPSAVCFSPFNESWGINDVGDDAEIQGWVREVVALTRRLAPGALVVDNSGWLHVDTDIFDVHLYDHDPAALRANLEEAIGSDWEVDRRLRFEAFGNWVVAADSDGMVEFDMSPSARGFNPRPFHGQPVVVSEMGGIGFVPPNPDWPVADTPDDRFVYSEAATADKFVESITGLVGVVEELGLAGWCWTQVSDVEQEQNGLLTYDRRPKVSAARVAEAIRSAIERRPG